MWNLKKNILHETLFYRFHLHSSLSPVFPALSNPHSHRGLESLPAHVRVLEVRVQELSQGSQFVLFSALSCEGLQVLHDAGGQHFSWGWDKSRKKKLAKVTDNYILIWSGSNENMSSQITCVAFITFVIHDVKELIFRKFICVFTVLKHLPCPTAVWCWSLKWWNIIVLFA